LGRCFYSPIALFSSARPKIRFVFRQPLTSAPIGLKYTNNKPVGDFLVGVAQKQSDLNTRVREHLRSGGFRAGDQLPGEREMATSLGVGRTALRPILNALEQEGVIERRPQAGTFLLSIPTPHARHAQVTLIAPFGGTGEPERATDPIWLHRVVSAFERIARPSGVQLVLQDQSPHAADLCSIKEMAHDAINEGARAVVMLHPLGTRDKISCALALLHDGGVHPVMVSSRSYPGLANSVYFDSGWGAYLATRHLLNAGHRRIAFAGAPGGHQWARERIEGYEQALEAAEIEAASRWIWTPDESERLATLQDGARALKQWLKVAKRTRPTAIVAANDAVALGFLAAAREQGIEVPRELSLIGFDNERDALLAGLTTIERPTETLGEEVARVTLERLAAGPEAAAVSHRLRPVLIERATVAPPDTSAAEKSAP